MNAPIRIIGIDPGLRHTGWGIVESLGSRLTYVAHGRISSTDTHEVAVRLNELYQGLIGVLTQFSPHEAAVEKVFVNKNPVSTLKLGMARGVALLAPAAHGIPVSEYEANTIKKSVVGQGHASKEQVAMMVSVLLPGCGAKDDGADALATAICHAHQRTLAHSFSPHSRHSVDGVP